MRTELEKHHAELWIWEHDGDLSRAKMELVVGGEVIQEFPWSKWVRFPTTINKGYWKKN